MTEEQALAKFDRLMHKSNGDAERQHSEADALLIQALRAAGWNRLADKWTDAAGDWWWA